MRAQLMRATSWAVLAALFASPGAGRAQPAAVARPPVVHLALPAGADEGAFGERTSAPPSVVLLAPGGLAWPAPANDPPARGTPLLPAPAALSFDDPPPAAATAAPKAPVAPEPAASGSPGPTPAADPTPSVSDGLDAASLTAALIAFVADTPPDETAARIAERRSQREAIGDVYAARGNAPLWVAGGHLTAAATAVMARLALAGEDALDLSRFVVPRPGEGDVASLARTELALSDATVAYARQAAGSRVNVSRIGALIDFRPVIPDAARVLGTVPVAADAGAALRAFNPPQQGYAALRDKLAGMRRDASAVPVGVPYGPALKPGMSDPRVPLLRTRFGLGPQDGPPSVYDPETVAAVAAFQHAHHMPASGVLTARTITALSAHAPAALASDIIANMELWRWMPRETAADRIEVNIPDYTARVLRDGAVAREARVVVGQPDKPTPVFAEQMRFIIVNPYWNVPLSIIKAEMMPKLASDPNYFADHGYEVMARNGVTYVRQPPGDGNALGRIKFMFPNSHSVYLHDTNARSYFDRDMRALSHGCVRVDQPFSFAEAVMGRENGWSEARIKKLIGGQERTINLPKPLPILITYFTAFVDPLAGLQIRDDVYGYAGKVKVALGLAPEAGASAVHPGKRVSAGAPPVVR